MKTKTVLSAALCAAMISTSAYAQINAGEQKAADALPFTMTQVATFNLPWRIAFLPDGKMLITEKVGPVYVVAQDGTKTQIANAPAVLSRGQGACSASTFRRNTPPTRRCTSRTPSQTRRPTTRRALPSRRRS